MEIPNEVLVADGVGAERVFGPFPELGCVHQAEFRKRLDVFPIRLGEAHELRDREIDRGEQPHLESPRVYAGHLDRHRIRMRIFVKQAEGVVVLPVEVDHAHLSAAVAEHRHRGSTERITRRPGDASMSPLNRAPV